MNGLDKLVEELGGNFLLGGAVIQFSDATFIDAFKTIYEAGSIAEREACIYDIQGWMPRDGRGEVWQFAADAVMRIRARGQRE